MDKVTIGFLFLLALLFISSLFLGESFVDASGSNVDSSGNKITLSLSDLFTLLGGGSQTTTTTSTVPAHTHSNSEESETTFDQQFYTNLKTNILSDVRETVRDTLQSSGGGAGAAANAGPVLTDSCINSVADQQGADFMRYIPGKNPADYIRKDSIPCYGCSIPT